MQLRDGKERYWRWDFGKSIRERVGHGKEIAWGTDWEHDFHFFAGRSVRVDEFPFFLSEGAFTRVREAADRTGRATTPNSIVAPKRCPLFSLFISCVRLGEYPARCRGDSR